MWSNWFEDAKKKAEEAFKQTSQIVSEGLQVAKKKAGEISQNAVDVMKEFVTRHPDDLTYIAQNVIAMGYPGWPKYPMKNVKYNMREVVASFLNDNHKDHYMIFNLSDEIYDTILFGDHVISYDLLGMPSPSLGMLMKICVAIETWLQDDEQNVAVIHCLTGKGRTLTICACLLAWLGWVENCSEALHLCCSRRGGKVEELTTPSQRRYIQYFGMLLDCIPPKKDPLLLRSIRLSNIPLEGPNPVVVVDVYNCGMNIFSTKVTVPSEAAEGELQEYTVDIVCGRPIRSNIIIRCRQQHLNPATNTYTYSSLCRAMFHTGYTHSSNLRLAKEQLDGACTNPRYPELMALEVSLEPSSTEYQTNIEVNRLEAYEGLLLDENSALFRELKVRKERRSHSQTPIATGEGMALDEKRGEDDVNSGVKDSRGGDQGEVQLTTTMRKNQTSGILFEIESDEEEEEEGEKGMRKMPLPKMDPGRDYMMELAMLESSLTADKQSSAVETANERMDEKGLTAEEEQNLDSIMKSLDFDDDDDEDHLDGGDLPDNLDLNALEETIGDFDVDIDGEDEDGDLETRDFSAEFGL